MSKLSRSHLTAAAAAAAAAAAVGGAAVAGAADTTSPATSPKPPADHRGPGGPGGPGHGPGARGDLTAVAKTLGVTEAKLRAAVEDARPADRPRGKGKGPDADRAADLAAALGVDTSKVQAILDANRPRPGTGHRPAPGVPAPGAPAPGPPADSAVVSALAKGLSKTEAEVRAALTKAEEAHRADHEARETAMYAAVAKALGKDAADVEAAFEAARPTP